MLSRAGLKAEWAAGGRAAFAGPRNGLPGLESGVLQKKRYG
jgi:hypothetical protein